MMIKHDMKFNHLLFINFDTRETENNKLDMNGTEYLGQDYYILNFLDWISKASYK